MSATDNDDRPTPAEMAGLRAWGLWLLLAGLSGDGERVADEGGRILRTRSAEVIGCVLGDLTRRLSQALVDHHGSTEAAIDAVTTELVELEMLAAARDSDE